MSRQRQQQRQEEVKKEILAAAKAIILKDGIDALSMRKIAAAIDYSPAILYHYFSDKKEIVDILLMEGYLRIVDAIGSIEINVNNPQVELRKVFYKFITTALQYPEDYKAFMLSTDPSALDRTSLLHSGAIQKNETLRMLYGNLKRGMDKGFYKPCDLELTAQVMWAATFGLILRISIEKPPRDQIDALVGRHLEYLMDAITI